MKEIGRYTVERELGRGGMAIVHLARQADLERPVALKELAGLWATDPTATKRFLREARLAGSLNHPNIVTVHEYFEHGGVPYIAMEFLPRGPLRPLVGTLTDQQVVGILDCILAGLAHADEHGIVHRDLKPENVMRTKDGAVKIADFGIATAYDELANANLTPLGEFVGASGYVSPEQVLGKTATTASDLYSVGVIAFELFTGAVPFAETGGGSALLVRKVNQRTPQVSSVRPDLDKRLAEWVDRLLERDPARRPDSAAAAGESLEDVAESALGPRWRREAPLPEGRPAPVTREPTGTLRTLELSRGLLANAVTRPLNLFVPALVIVAGIVLERWLFFVAAALYLVLVLITYFDEAEAHRLAEARRPATRADPGRRA
ncbi:MAG TPA: serine/threonine-protein kinase [Gaiellaceae bacterium]|nr:serine/threonine-protein kinase [Gaiellaceae bacterium]